VYAGITPITSFQGPVRFVADWSVPYGQSKIRLPFDASTDTVAGGLTVTITVAGTEEQLPTVTVTL
jgi:hypothetical protein